MRTRNAIEKAGFLSVVLSTLLISRDASAQTLVPRDQGLGTVSDVTMAVGVGLVSLMPRVYYNDPESTVGWKGRWHFSVLAPAMTLTAFTFIVDGSIKNAIKDPRPGCTLDTTSALFPGSGCESFGMPSTESFGAWGASGAGLSVFLVDTFKYSNGKFNPWGFVGNVALPVTLSLVTSILRGVAPGGEQAYENGGQIAVGSLTGFATGALVGLGYSLLQRPNCGYGNQVFCW
jgi:hypothetical protein